MPRSHTLVLLVAGLTVPYEGVGMSLAGGGGGKGAPGCSTHLRTACSRFTVSGSSSASCICTGSDRFHDSVEVMIVCMYNDENPNARIQQRSLHLHGQQRARGAVYKG
eukprot:1160443-Pelagomonas_calceolata.AAC.2